MKRIVSIMLLVLIAMTAVAQKRKVQNKPYIDLRPMHFGILVGMNRVVELVFDSRIWLHRLKQKIVEAKGRGEPVWITIK